MKRLYPSLTLLIWAFAQPVFGQAPEAGSLLVSGPAMDDPDFRQTVMLLLVQDNGTSAAVMLNRPTWVVPTEAFPDVAGLSRYRNMLHLGGPVAPDQLLTLFESNGVPPVGARHVVGNVYLSATPDIFSTINFAAENAPRVKVFAGHTQWGPDQLAREIAAGNWRVVPATSDLVFSADPNELWQRAQTRGDVTAMRDAGATPSRSNTADPSTSRSRSEFPDLADR